MFENCHVVTSEWKEIRNFSFFIMGVAKILAGLGRLTKTGHKHLRGPHNGAWVNKILKITFENVSKMDYITLVSDYLMDIGYSLNLKYLKVRT